MTQRRFDIPIARLCAAACLTLASAAHSAPAVEIAGIRPEPQLSVNHTALQLNGAGLRSKFVVKVYVAALYAATVSHDAQTLIHSAEPRRMRLYLLRDIDSKTLDEALQDGLRDNTPESKRESLRESATRFSNLMAAIGTTKNGDIVDLDFDASGLSLTHNGQSRGRIDNADFAAALLAVWLGDKPAQASLKQALLGN